LSQILGLNRAKTITQMLGDESNGVSSVLLYGPRGCGKTLLVNQITELWLGSEADSTERAIQSFRRGANPDFFHIHPSGPSNNIRLRSISFPSQKEKDDPIPLIEFIRVTPLYSRNKVVWIEDADRLLEDASNSLLKPLEEPPDYVKLILTTNQISRIRPTILSRCLVINCELPTDEEMSIQFAGTPKDLHFLAEGSPGVLTKVSENVEIYWDVVSFADRLVGCSPHQAIVLSEEFKKLSDRLDEAEKLGARTANARTLELVGIALSKRHPSRVDAIHEITKAHRRVISNASANLVLDALIGKIVLENKSGTKS